MFKVLSEVGCKSQSTIRIYGKFISGYTNMFGERPPQEKIIRYLHYLKTVKRVSNSTLNTAKFAIIYYYEDIL